MRFHVLGLPHTATNAEHLSCAYTQKVRKLCGMLKQRGHYVIHYGNEASDADCHQHVSVTTTDDLNREYGDRWKSDFYTFSNDDAIYRKFFAQAINAIGWLKQKNDILLCMWGWGHKPVADAHSDLIAVEPGIGYPHGQFARWRVYESYAIMHSSLGTAQPDFYHTVIPNYFDPDDFQFSAEKDDYLLFLGRIHECKGVHIAGQVAKAAGVRLVVAGPGPRSAVPDGAVYAGFAGLHARAKLLARAKALIAPTLFMEPFGGVQIEAMMSGTPVISTDWGAFAEHNIHGTTGFRCRTFKQFVDAVKTLDQIDPQWCRDHAMNFTTTKIAARYEDYFRDVMDVYTGDGWYQL